MSVTGWLDRFQQKHAWAGFPLAVIYKYFDDQGAYLAALITYYGFLSLFPLLLLLVTILGYTLDGDPHLKQQILDSALNQFPVIGEQLGGQLQQLSGNGLALAVGIIGSLYGALGVAQAAQNALNRVWAVPRGERPNPFLARLRSLILLLVIGLGLIMTTAIATLPSYVGTFGVQFNIALSILLALVTIAMGTLLFGVAFRVLTAIEHSFREVLPGAFMASLAWFGLQKWGATYVQQVKGSTPTYGLFAVVLGLVAYIYLAAVIVVLSAEVNVVIARRLYPRSLLTPFTDSVVLTGADRRAYASYPEIERHKGFENVEVDFDGQDEPSEDGPF